MCDTIPEHSPLLQQLNRTVKTLMMLLLADTDRQTFLTQHCMLSLRSDSKLLALVDTSHIYELYLQLYKHSSHLHCDFSNILEVLDSSLKKQLLARIPHESNLVVVLQQSFIWQLDEEAMFIDLFKLALPQLADPDFYQQFLAVLADDTTIPDDFDLIILDKYLTACQTLEPYYYDLRILLSCTAILLAKYPQIRYVLTHTRSFEKDLGLVWKIHSIDYTLAIAPPEK